MISFGAAIGTEAEVLLPVSDGVSCPRKLHGAEQGRIDSAFNTQTELAKSGLNQREIPVGPEK